MYFIQMKGSKKHALPVVSQESTHFHTVSDEVVACSMCAQVQNELTNILCVTRAKLKGIFLNLKYGMQDILDGTIGHLNVPCKHLGEREKCVWQ